jgi:cell division protein FtsQ
MLKKLLTILSVIVVISLVAYITIDFTDKRAGDTCTDVQVLLMDEAGTSFISETEIQRLLAEYGVRLKGKKLDRIDYEAVEQIVKRHKMVERAECYACPSGVVCISIWQHIPVLRLFDGNSSAYIDRNGRKTGLSTLTAADVVVATGSVQDSVTVRSLYKMALLLQDHPDWDALIEQVHVEPNREWVLIPRIGELRIEFGRPVNMETKLKRIAVFMKKYLPKMGWNTYSTINVKFDNQIICTKKEAGDE